MEVGWEGRFSVLEEDLCWGRLELLIEIFGEYGLSGGFVLARSGLSAVICAAHCALLFSEPCVKD